MFRGFNSDLIIKGKTYHVQTEDWGTENPFIVTKIFNNGAVVKTIKTPYESLTKTKTLSLETVQKALDFQHQQVIEALRLNKFQIAP